MILSFAAFRLHPAATMRTALRQWNGDPFIYALRDWTARLPAVVASGFAARRLRIGFGAAPRMRGGLALTGAQCGFQFSAQPLRLPVGIALGLRRQPDDALNRPNHRVAFRTLRVA